MGNRLLSGQRCGTLRHQIGDASGIQSPLSFGGFGAMTRHLRRLTGAVTEAVQVLTIKIKKFDLLVKFLSLKLSKQNPCKLQAIR